MRDVTTEDVQACIKKYGLYGLNSSELRQLIREPAQPGDFAALVRQTAARQVLVSKLEQNLAYEAAPTETNASERLLAEYTRLHEELAEMIVSGRITPTQLKGDHLWLVDALERINAARLALGIRKVSVSK